MKRSDLMAVVEEKVIRGARVRICDDDYINQTPLERERVIQAQIRAAHQILVECAREKEKQG